MGPLSPNIFTAPVLPEFVKRRVRNGVFGLKSWDDRYHNATTLVVLLYIRRTSDRLLEQNPRFARSPRRHFVASLTYLSSQSQ
jgi:hypothetical protein